jgi:hypothetical protein
MGTAGNIGQQPESKPNDKITHFGAVVDETLFSPY